MTAALLKVMNDRIAYELEAERACEILYLSVSKRSEQPTDWAESRGAGIVQFVAGIYGQCQTQFLTEVVLYMTCPPTVPMLPSVT